MVAAGIFATSLANTPILALPFRESLKNRFHLGPTAMASFFAVAAAPWYVKVFIGWLSDRVPIAGERRRPYYVLAALLAALAWTMVALPTSHVSWLLAGAVGANAASVIASTVSGGLLVEAGQRFGLTQRLAQIRNAFAYGAVVPAMWMAGWLADRPLVYTALLPGALMTALAPLAWKLLGPDEARPDATTFGEALRRLVRARGLWAITAFIFLLQLAPGFQTPLFYIQTNQLGFSPLFIGTLNSLASAVAMLVSLQYHRLVRRTSMTGQLRLAVFVSIAGALAYIGYLSRGTALAIEVLAAIATALTQVPLFTVAARAAPRGLEGVAYALVASLFNVATQLSDVFGSLLYEHGGLGLRGLICANAASSLLALALIRFIPSELLGPERGAVGISKEAG